MTNKLNFYASFEKWLCSADSVVSPKTRDPCTITPNDAQSNPGPAPSRVAQPPAANHGEHSSPDGDEVAHALVCNAAYFSCNRAAYLIVGRSPWTAADALVGLSRLSKALVLRTKERVQGVCPGGCPTNSAAPPILGRVCGISRFRLPLLIVEIAIPGMPPQHRQCLFRQRSFAGHGAIGLRVPQAAHPRNHRGYSRMRKAEAQRHFG